MIPQAHIIEWSNFVPWQTNEQVEQDLVISRSLVEIFKNEFLASRLAFRGGTALHKLYLLPQSRYSEDIDLVQINQEPIGPILDELRVVLSFLGKASVDKGDPMIAMQYRFESEIPPITRLRLKIETNCREHFAELGWEYKEFKVESAWFTGDCKLTTYKLEELLGTKIRALYQRKKGRDLYDLYKALIMANPDRNEIVKCYKKYMEFSDGGCPSIKEYLINLENKMKDAAFTGDMAAIIHPEEKYDQELAFDFVSKNLIELFG